MARGQSTYRAGGKICGSHGTCAEIAGDIADAAQKCLLITRIRLGFISGGHKSAKGNRRVKLVHEEGCLLLKVRDHTHHQEVRLYVTDGSKAQKWLADMLTDMGLPLLVMESASD